MLTTIKSEIKRRGSNKTMWLLLLVMICINILMGIAMNQFFGEEPILGIEEPYLRTFLLFTNMSNLFSILYGAVIGYRILSTEHKEGTWELLLLTIKDKRKIIFAKYFLYIAFLFLAKLIALIMYVLIMLTYYSLNPLHLEIIPFLLAYFFADFFQEACVFVLLLMLSNGTLAVGLSFLFFLSYTFLRGFSHCGKYIPLIFGLWFYNHGWQEPLGELLLLCVWNVITSVAFVALMQKKFHLQGRG